MAIFVVGTSDVCAKQRQMLVELLWQAMAGFKATDLGFDRYICQSTNNILPPMPHLYQSYRQL